MECKDGNRIEFVLRAGIRYKTEIGAPYPPPEAFSDALEELENLLADNAALDELKAESQLDNIEIERLTNEFERQRSNNKLLEQRNAELTAKYAEIDRLRKIEETARAVYAVLTRELAEPKGTETAAMVLCCTALEDAFISAPAEAPASKKVVNLCARCCKRIAEAEAEASAGVPMTGYPHVCVWTKSKLPDGAIIYLTSCSDSWTQIGRVPVDEVKLCPYCGRKIAVKGAEDGK